MDTKFKPGEYKTRNGQTAHVIYVEDDKAFAFPIIGRIDGNPYFTTWTRNGAKFRGFNEDESDLMPRMRKVWINLYRTGPVGYHDTREEADSWHGAWGHDSGRIGPRIGCIEVEIPE